MNLFHTLSLHRLSNWPLWLLMAMACTLFTHTSSATTIASVDRNPVAVNETFELTLTTDSEDFYVSDPDFSALESSFNILAQGKETNITNNSKLRRWRLRLSPKKQGSLMIPAIKIAGQMSKPILMNVRPSDQSASPQSNAVNKELYLESMVDSNTVYQNAQFIYTVRVYSSVQIGDASLSTPDFGDAIVKTYDDKQKQQLINGVAYSVIERRYAVFPRTVGEQVIKPAVLQAQVAFKRDNFGRLQMRQISRQSDMATVNVIAPPAGSSSSNWLPAKNLSLKQRWSGSVEGLKVGDSITRSITIDAQGITAIQLPPITPPVIDGLKFYADRPDMNDVNSAAGIDASRTESYAVIATKPGRYQLPAIKVEWFDTVNNQAQTATIPAVTIDVAANPDAAPAIIVPPSGDIQKITAQPSTTPVTAHSLYSAKLWMAISAILAFLLLATLAYCIKLRRSGHHNTAAAVAQPKAAISDKKAFATLAKYCRQNNHQMAESALLQWGKCFWPEQRIASVGDILLHCDSPRLNTAWQQLQQANYQGQSTSWQGQSLLAAVEDCRHARSTQTESLAPLYPL